MTTMTKFKIIKTQNKTIDIKIKKSGKYIFFFYNFSGEIKIQILNKNIDVKIFGLYFGQKNKSFSLKTLQHHKALKSKSNLLIRGLFFDQSKLNFKGLIKIDKQAQGSQAYQKIQNLVFSSDCLIETRPYLEILADDIKCTHGATVGQLNKDQIYYLRSRGITKISSKKLLMQGFINEIFDKIIKYGFEKDIKKNKSLVLNNLKNVKY